MFKNASVFEVTPDWAPSLGDFQRLLPKMAFVECAPTQAKSVGLSPPRGEKHGALVESVGRHWLMKVTIEQRVLPGSVLKKELDKRLAKLKELSGRVPGKKEMARLKIEVTQDLLPKAFTKQDSVLLWLDRMNSRMVLDTTSKGKISDVLGILSATLDRFFVRPMTTAHDPPSSMSQWLLDGEPPAGFSIDDECVLQEPDGTKGAVRYSRHDVDIDQVREHLREGMRVSSLAITFNSRLSFVLTSKLQLRKIHFLDVALKDPGYDAGAAFDSSIALLTGELTTLLPEISGMFGGPEPDLFVEDGAANEQQETTEDAEA